MIEEKFGEIHRKFRLKFYEHSSKAQQPKSSKLTASESFCAEVIDVLANPTIGDLVEFSKVSQPNVTARVNSLVEKGFVEKITPKYDRRVVQLKVTDKYRQYHWRKTAYARQFIKNLLKDLKPEELKVIEKVVDLMNKNLDMVE